MAQPVSVAELLALVRDVPDFPTPGVLFKDITPLLADGRAFAAVVEALAAPHRRQGEVDVVVGIEARGFILAAPVAVALGVGFVPVRKAGKLPARGRVGHLRAGVRHRRGRGARRRRSAPASGCCVIDDVLATGGTAAAAGGLVRQLGGVLVGVSVLMELASSKAGPGCPTSPYGRSPASDVACRSRSRHPGARLAYSGRQEAVATRPQLVEAPVAEERVPPKDPGGGGVPSAPAPGQPAGATGDPRRAVTPWRGRPPGRRHHRRTRCPPSRRSPSPRRTPNPTPGRSARPAAAAPARERHPSRRGTGRSRRARACRPRAGCSRASPGSAPAAARRRRRCSSRCCVPSANCTPRPTSR